MSPLPMVSTTEVECNLHSFVPTVWLALKDNPSITFNIVSEVLLDPSNTNKHYKFYVIKQGKKQRQIEEPLDYMKEILRFINVRYLRDLYFSPNCTSINGSSYVKNAEYHIRAQHVLKIDIKSCYQSINYQYLLNSLANQPPFMVDKPYMAKLCQLSFVTTKHYGNHLSTGSPISPKICNLALTPIDYQITSMLHKQYPNKYVYTRYLDDMILSTKDNKRDWELLDKVQEIIKENGLLPHPKKSLWYNTRSDQCFITGVRIHPDLSTMTISREFKYMLRARLDNIAKENKQLDSKTVGYLAHVKNIDLKKYEYFLNYFDKRKKVYELTA